VAETFADEQLVTGCLLSHATLFDHRRAQSPLSRYQPQARFTRGGQTTLAERWGNERDQAGDLEVLRPVDLGAVSDRRSDLDTLAAVHCHSTVVLQVAAHAGTGASRQVWVRACMRAICAGR
jgi:hypothetical protein